MEPIKEDVPDILGGTAKDSPPVDYPLHSQNWDTPEKMTINSVRQPLTPKSVNFAPESKADGPMTPTQKLLLEKKAKFEVDDKGKKMREMEKDAKGYMDRVIENFRKSQATIFTHQIVENAVPFEPGKHQSENVMVSQLTFAGSQRDDQWHCRYIPDRALPVI